MKYATLKILAILSVIMIVSPARAGHAVNGDTYYDKAKVVSAVPIYKTISVSIPRRECRQVPVVSYCRGGGQYKSVTPIVVGGIVGAAVGHQFGHGTGRTVGAIAGGVLGGSVARDIQHRYIVNNASRNSYPQTMTQCDACEDFHEEQVIDGYQVEYRYNNHVYHTVTENDPGKKMLVRVSVAPSEY